MLHLSKHRATCEVMGDLESPSKRHLDIWQDSSKEVVGDIIHRIEVRRSCGLTNIRSRAKEQRRGPRPR